MAALTLGDIRALTKDLPDDTPIMAPDPGCGCCSMGEDHPLTEAEVRTEDSAPDGKVILRLDF